MPPTASKTGRRVPQTRRPDEASGHASSATSSPSMTKAFPSFCRSRVGDNAARDIARLPALTMNVGLTQSPGVSSLGGRNLSREKSWTRARDRTWT